MIKTIFQMGYQLIFKAASAALFGILLLIAFALTAPMENHIWYGLYRYDYLFFYAVVIQLFLIYFRLESLAEAKVIALFHLLGLIMELFLTHPAIASWHYPQPALFKISTVPLFAGFMYASVGSFLARSLRLFQAHINHLPPFKSMLALAILSYLNFMTKYFIVDIRYLLLLGSFILFYKTIIYLNIRHHKIKIPMIILFVLLAILIWIAENISTFYKIWLYPSQVEMWKIVSWQKIGSWYLLLILSFVFVLKVLGNNRNGLWKISV